MARLIPEPQKNKDTQNERKKIMKVLVIGKAAEESILFYGS